jgi:hypothetical protein
VRSAWPGDTGQVAVLQDRYSVSFSFDLAEVNEAALGILFGPRWLLAWQFSRISPHWYLRGEDCGIHPGAAGGVE